MSSMSNTTSTARIDAKFYIGWFAEAGVDLCQVLLELGASPTVAAHMADQALKEGCRARCEHLDGGLLACLTYEEGSLGTG